MLCERGGVGGCEAGRHKREAVQALAKVAEPGNEAARKIVTLHLEDSAVCIYRVHPYYPLPRRHSARRARAAQAWRARSARGSLQTRQAGAQRAVPSPSNRSNEY